MDKTLSNAIWAKGEKIFFFADFNEDTVNFLTKLVEKNSGKKDLTLVLKSYGGSVDEFRQAVDLIKKYNIRVHASGYIMSAGFYLWCAAQLRSAEPNTKFMYHEMNYGKSRDDLTNHKLEVEQNEKEQKWLDSLITATGGFEQEELDAIKTSKQSDYYFFYEEAKERKMINYYESQKEKKINLGEVEVE